MDKTKRKQKGFTLVELIVVLVILAILAAILVPALTGYIDKAREKTAVSQCRACVEAAQSLASECYGTDADFTLSADSDKILSLAELTNAGTITELDLNSQNIIDKLVWKSSNDIVVTYANKEYTIGQTNGLTSSYVVPMPNVLSTIKSVLGTNSGTIDSTSTSETGKKRLDALKEKYPDLNNILSNANVSSWKIAENGKALYMSDVDITQCEVGDSVRIIRYNDSDAYKTYTAGYMTVSTNSNGDKVFSDSFNTWKEPDIGQTSATKKSYEQTLSYYNQMESVIPKE